MDLAGRVNFSFFFSGKSECRRRIPVSGLLAQRCQVVFRWCLLLRSASGQTLAPIRVTLWRERQTDSVQKSWQITVDVFNGKIVRTFSNNLSGCWI